MSDSYDDYETKIQLAEQAWEKRVVKTEHNKQLEIAQAYERGWNAALAQQEPVAWISDSPTKGNGKQLHWTKSEAWRWSSNITPLYTAPPKRELVCVCGAVWEGEEMVHSPRKRKWVGLTDEERSYYLQSASNVGWWQAAKMIEAKLKEKNT